MSHSNKESVGAREAREARERGEFPPDPRAAELAALRAENARQKAEIASLRLTLGGRTFSADVPELIGCPLPGACAQVAEIGRLREALERIAVTDEVDLENPWEPGDAYRTVNRMIRSARAALEPRP